MNRTSRLLIVLATALVCATVASYTVYNALARQLKAEESPKLVATLVAARPIPAGALVTKDMLRSVAWPATSRVPGSYTDAKLVLDRGAVVAIAENEPITESKLAAVGAGAGLPPTIPPGMRAISVRVNEVIGVAGFVVPGTRVDVVVTFEAAGQSKADQDQGLARVVVSNVQVLTAGTRYDQEKARQDARPIPTSVVTLLVSPEDAERIALGSAKGRITLTLRNPLDTAPTDTTGIRMAGLMGMPSPPPPVERPPAAHKRPAPSPQPPPPPQPAPQPYTVEAIRGAKRTQEPVRMNEPGETIKP
jgi:pilus assembly protein CpaB